MCFLRPEHFTGVLLFVYAINYTSSNSLVYGASLNTSEEIKKIFNGDNGTKKTTSSYIKELSRFGNFAEGGLLNLNSSPPTPTRKIDTTVRSGKHILSNNSTKQLSEPVLKSNNNTKRILHRLSTMKTLPAIKLNDTGSNLFLGVPEVIHINGTSSIKPRKGVYYNKIVPRKGVQNESGANHYSSNHSCIRLGKNYCYNSKGLHEMDCKCCEEENALGKTFRQNYSLNCKNCTPVISEFPEDKHICRNICCHYKFHELTSVSNTQDSFIKNVSFTSMTEFKKENASSYGAFANSTKKFKHKPVLTKVPYDLEVVNEIISKHRQKVFVPVIVSLLLLPLVGILVFVVFRKIKEIWDKRYYKRMDFLIDGMYQD